MKKAISNKFSYEGLYALTFAVAGTIILIWDFVDLLFLESYLSKYNLLYTDKGTIFISYFTQQSNIIVIIYFYFMSFFHFNKKNLNRHSFLIRLFITVYITVTSIVFTAGLLPGLIDRASFDLSGWIFTVFLHYIIPFGMIFYFFWMAGTFHYSLKKFAKESLYKIYLYPFFYFTYVMVRGELRHQNPAIHGLYSKFSLESFDVEYPYWFLNYHHYSYGVAMIVMSLLFMFLLVGALTFIYLVLNNFMFEKRQYKASRIVKR